MSHAIGSLINCLSARPAIASAHCGSGLRSNPSAPIAGRHDKRDRSADYLSVYEGASSPCLRARGIES
jgi:hypothetical protein